jgi:hypothetical protein
MGRLHRKFKKISAGTIPGCSRLGDSQEQSQEGSALMKEDLELKESLSVQVVPVKDLGLQVSFAPDEVESDLLSHIRSIPLLNDLRLAAASKHRVGFDNQIAIVSNMLKVSACAFLFNYLQPRNETFILEFWIMSLDIVIYLPLCILACGAVPKHSAPFYRLLLTSVRQIFKSQIYPH